MSRLQCRDGWAGVTVAVSCVKSSNRQFASPCASSERWDEAAINEYGDFATFRAIADTETYRREVAPHRHAALEDFRLFALAKAM